MLAQNFLTADELKCDEGDLAAAIAVLAMLERGELVLSLIGQKPQTVGLNMGLWFIDNDSYCGTVGCIGGWMEKIKGEELTYHVQEAWQDIFCPRDWVCGEKFTAERCAKALRAKLTTGHADWSE